MRNFNEKLVFLIGGSSGIGLETAKALAERGAHIVIFARNAERLDQAVRDIETCRRDVDQRVVAAVLDVSNHEEVDRVLKNTVEEQGAPDILINMAGRAYPKRFSDISYGQFDETMRVNLYGIWNSVAALAPIIKERGGYIVNTSSLAGLIGVYGYTDYCASKFAIVGFSEVLRSELKPHGVTVSVLCPPDTDTPGFEVENTTKPEETRAISEAAKLMSPKKVAESLLRGMGRKRMLIIPGFGNRITVAIARIAPWLVEMVTDRAVRKVARSS